MTSKHKAYAVILGLAGVGWVGDRLLLGAAGPAEAAADLVVQPAARSEPQGVASAAAALAASEAAAMSLAERMRDFAAAQRLEVAEVGDAFRSPRDWMRPAAPEAQASAGLPTANRATRASRFAAEHRLTAVLGRADSGLAVINGRTVRLGQVVDGFTLRGVDRHTAMLEADGEQVVLRIASEPAFQNAQDR